MPHATLTRRRFTLAAAATSLAFPSFAQSAWPNKPIRIIVPYTPGGFTDQMARLVQMGLQARLGQPVLVDNKPGANSLIGVDAIAKAAPSLRPMRPTPRCTPSCRMTRRRT
jgi:tripartite-type tricarboxylate transporter receptor subunit TctC